MHDLLYFSLAIGYVYEHKSTLLANKLRGIYPVPFWLDDFTVYAIATFIWKTPIIIWVIIYHGSLSYTHTYVHRKPSVVFLSIHPWSSQTSFGLSEYIIYLTLLCQEKKKDNLINHLSCLISLSRYLSLFISLSLPLP